VRQGRVFEIDLEDAAGNDVAKIIPEIADKVLANPIIEKFTWQVIEE
jgi:phosphoribosylformylglycinamidine (FGAM) synthase PurS component